MKDSNPVRTDIISLHPDGYGVGQDDLAVFGALPGETIVAKPFARRRKKVFAKTLSVLEAAGERVEPPCAAAGVCGGCALQHLDPREQLFFKQGWLLDALGDHTPDEILPPLYGPVIRYRAKARLGVKYVARKGRVLVGFREKMNSFIAETGRCEILKEPAGELLTPLADLIEDLSCPTAIPQIEVAAGDREMAFVVRHLEPLLPADLEKLASFSRNAGIRLFVQSGGPETADEIHPRDGSRCLHYSLPTHDLELGFHPLDFIQVNPAINRDMVSRALLLLGLRSTDVVVDAFCGIGNFSLAAARTAAFVHGLESSPGSIARARENAASNRIENCNFHRIDLHSHDLDISAFGDANKWLLDPPRTGAHSLIKKLASSNVERVVYVSCNPHTLARDSAALVEGGYRFEKAGVIDMFPHTAHIESIAVYSR